MDNGAWAGNHAAQDIIENKMRKHENRRNMEDDLQQASEDPLGSSVENTDMIFSQFSSLVLNVLKVGHSPTNITALN